MSFDKLGIAVHDFPCDTVAHSYKSKPAAKLLFVRGSGLGMGHRVTHCPWNRGCRMCKLGHHTLMHPLDDAKYWMKMTAKVYLTSLGRIESPIKVRVLLDPFAQYSLLLRRTFARGWATVRIMFESGANIHQQ